MTLKREAATSHKAFQVHLCAWKPCRSEWPPQKFIQLSICQLQARRRPGAKKAPGDHPTRWGPTGQTSVKFKKSSNIHQTQRPLQEKRLPPCMRHFKNIFTCMEAITFRMNFIQNEFHRELSSHPHANSGMGGGLGPSGRQATTQTSEGYQGKHQRNSVTQQHLLKHRGPYRKRGCLLAWDFSIHFHAWKP